MMVMCVSKPESDLVVSRRIGLYTGPKNDFKKILLLSFELVDSQF